jgi:hypothetical protein
MNSDKLIMLTDQRIGHLTKVEHREVLNALEADPKMEALIIEAAQKRDYEAYGVLMIGWFNKYFEADIAD